MIIFSLQDLTNGRDKIRWERGSSRPSSPSARSHRSSSAPGNPARVNGFTLVELLVSTAIIALIMLLLVQVTNNISAAWRGTAEKVEKFQGARDGFEAMTRRISQATLNTYWDYYDISGVTRNQSSAIGTFLPYTYGRQSDLRFVAGPMSGVPWSITQGSTMPGGSGGSGASVIYMPTHGIFFAAPLGLVNYTDQPIYGAMDNLLNTWGYFVEINSDANPVINIRPPFITAANTQAQRWRGRLMELEEPTENMCSYDVSYTVNPTPNTFRDWFVNSLNPTILGQEGRTRPCRVMAENVIALIFLPKLSAVDETLRKAQGWSLLSPEFTYDSSIPPGGSAHPSANTGVQPKVGTTCNPGATPSTNALDAGGVDPRNQLPPEIQVIMIALDERSAQRLIDLTNQGASAANASATSLPDPTLGRIYTNNSSDGNPLFTTAIRGPSGPYTNQLGDAETAGTDIYNFTQNLLEMKLSYRIFNTNVTIRGAKWSRGQTD
jgi:uncharacterized protein (TIGR02599 family)